MTNNITPIFGLSAEGLTLFRTIYGEARGEDRRGWELVALVILNRTRDPKRWPKTISGVCKQPKQFSCWNSGDPNLKKIMSLWPDQQNELHNGIIQAMAYAYGLLADDFACKSDDGRINHYHARNIAPPKWAADMRLAMEWGGHYFYVG